MSSVAIDSVDRDRFDTPIRVSAMPLLSPELSDHSSAYPNEAEKPSEQENGKSSRRRFFGLGRRQEDGRLVDERSTAWRAGQTSPPRAISPTSAPSIYSRPSTSPQMPNHPYQNPSSPYWHARSPSPGLPSPASSSIFERDVQESTLPAPPSVAIPSHISREDYIPPVLEASSLAITDEHLDPDEVKIVMHASHQPAAAPVAGFNSVDASISTLPDQSHAVDKDGEASNYAALDAHDVRRLSFISFADVVQAEHMSSKDIFPSTSLPSPFINRSPSPVYSRASSQGLGTSPPISGPTSTGGFESAPGVPGKGPSSPLSAHAPHSTGELTMETMSEAVRKTGNSDLVGVRSQPLSPSSGEEFSHDVSWRQ